MAGAVELQDPALDIWTGRLAGLTFRRPGLALGLWGEAGIGKTHRAQALLRGVPCRSVTVQAAQPLAAVALVLPRPRKLSAWLERALERLQTGQEPAPAELPVMLSGLLAAGAPFILHVEDLHELPAERLDLWTQVALAMARTRGVGLLATSRVQPPAGFEAVRLQPLDRAGSDALLRAEAGATLPPEALAWLFEHAAGNPLFTLEFFRLLARQGSLWNDGRQWRWRAPRREVMPVTVEAVIERALRDALSTDELVQAFSAKVLLPLEADDALLSTVAGLSPEALVRVQDDLECRGVLSQGGFAHPLYREVGAKSLDPRQRQALARRSLQALEVQAPESAAVFIAEAGIPPAEALQLLRRAAERVRNAGRPHRYARLLEQAAEYALGDEQAALASEAARILLDHDLSSAARLAEVALGRRPGDLEAVHLLAEVYARRLDLPEAERVLRRTPVGDQDGPALHKKMLELRVMARQYGPAFALWEEHRRELSRIADPFFYGQIAFCLIICDREDEAFKLATTGLNDFDCTPEERAKLLGIQAMFYSRRGELAKAAQLFGFVTREYETIGSPRRTAAAYGNLAISRGQCGDYQGQADAWRMSVAQYEVFGDLYRAGVSKVALADALIKLGEYQEAEDLLTGFQTLLRDDDLASVVTYHNAMCDLYIAWQTPVSRVALRKYAERSVHIARHYGNTGHLIDSLTRLLVAELAGGHVRQADGLSQEIIRLTATEEDPQTKAASLRSRAAVLEALGARSEAVSALEQAGQIAQQHKLEDGIHLAGLELARLAADVERARSHLAWFRQQGLKWAVDRAMAYFSELAEQVHTPLKPEPAARLYLLGDLLFSDGDAPRPLRGRKRQELLALLAEARLSGRAEVSRLGLLDALYPGTPEPQANAALRDVVHQVRAECGAGLVQTTTGGYALGNVRLDAEEFLSGGDTRLWRGPYLAGLTLDAAEDSVRDALSLALRARAVALLTSDPAEAARVGRLLLEADPYDQASLRLTLQALRAGQNHKSLKRTYEQARTRFLEVGERLPEGWAEFLKEEDIITATGAGP